MPAVAVKEVAVGEHGVGAMAVFGVVCGTEGGITATGQG